MAASSCEVWGDLLVVIVAAHLQEPPREGSWVLTQCVVTG